MTQHGDQHAAAVAGVFVIMCMSVYTKTKFDKNVPCIRVLQPPNHPPKIDAARFSQVRVLHDEARSPRWVWAVMEALRESYAYMVHICTYLQFPESSAKEQSWKGCI